MKARISVLGFESKTSKSGNQYQVLQCFATLQDDSGIGELRVFDPALFIGYPCFSCSFWRFRGKPVGDTISGLTTEHQRARLLTFS